MKLGIVVNDVLTEKAGYTTNRIAMAAVNRKHETWVMGVHDMAYDPDGTVSAHAVHIPAKRYKSSESYLRDLQSPRSPRERICMRDLDILLLRNNPADDAFSRPWAQNAGINLGRMAMRSGVVVLNDPNGLAAAANKLYLEYFPEEVRPRTLVTRNRDDIRAFAREQNGTIVLKPLQGSGGQNVFLVRPSDMPNLNQMIDAVVRDGYVIAQEYLPAAEKGDMRLFLLNGNPMRYKGKYCAFRRERAGEDMRSNVHAGGSIAQAVVDDAILKIVEIVRPKIVQDGMFLVGLDIVGDKLMEINVFSPGGLGSAQKFEGVNFSIAVVQALERKVEYMKYYQRNFDNNEMATL